jgi:hypothetical protein
MITATTTASKKFEYIKEVISIRKSKKDRQYNGQKRMKLARGSVGGACVAHLSFCFEETLYRTFHRCFFPIFCTFGYSASEEKNF